MSELEKYTILNDQGATASVVNEADSRIYYKTFDGKFIPYLIEGEASGGGITAETDPIYTADKPNIALKSELPTKLSQLTNDEGYIKTYTETDPIYTADKPNIALKSELPTKLSELDNDEGYIKTYTETDPIYTADKPNIALKSELFSGSYEDLTDKPEIFEPTTTGDGTKFLSDNGAYLAAGGGSDYEITFYDLEGPTPVEITFDKSAHYFPRSFSPEPDFNFNFTITDAAITEGGFSFVFKAIGVDSGNLYTIDYSTSQPIKWATELPSELEYGKWYILAVENYVGVFKQLL